MLEPMTLVLLAALALALALFFAARSRRQTLEVAKDTTPAIDEWIASALERELAESALGMRTSTTEERRPLARTLRGEPDPDVVSRIEDAVKSVELEFVRYAHEPDAELTVRVRYEDGRSGASTRRVAWGDVPAAIRADFDRRSATRVFRTWAFPWARVHAL
jgi:hypothetical protein